MLIQNANILTMHGQDFPNGYMLVKNEKIEEIGSMEHCPSNDAGEVLDLQGKTLLPGFVDAHSHLGLYEEGLGIEGDDINEDSEPCTPHLRALDGINPLDRGFDEALEAGVTTVVVAPGSSNPIGGQVCAMKTAGSWVDEMAFAQPLAIKFALGENPKMTFNLKNQTPVTRMATAALIREQLFKARRYQEELMLAEEDDERDEPEYDARCEALLPLLQGEIRAHFHCHKAYDILSAVRIAREFALPFTLIHCTEGYLIRDILARLEEPFGIVCGPLISSRSKPELTNLSLSNCASLAEMGLDVAICTDHPEIPSAFLPMSAMLAATNGLPERKALESITSTAAKSVGIFDRVGSLAAGKDADFLVIEGEPLKLQSRPNMVFVQGKRVR